ncbi:MAG: hypothetical protein HY928_16505 [Elusimicrobia bacterium]|nr:hypothetical protein [Elusimicrobiota bacterium]
MRRPSLSGFTLAEAVVGIAVLAIVGLAVAGLFKAGLKASTYTLNQLSFLSSARMSVLGDASRHGLVWTGQESSSSASLSTGTLVLGQSAGAAVTFRTTAATLLRGQLGVEQVQAEGISSLTLAYYNLDESGRVIESTAAAGAAFVTFDLGVTRPRSGEQRFFSGARLRNR